MAFWDIGASAILGGITSLFGGKMNQDAQAQANANNLAWAREQSEIQQGQWSTNRSDQLAQAAKNEALQKEFAQSSLQWKADDARKAGIHPIYAMGAAGAGFSPVSIAGGQSSPVGATFTPETGMGSAIQSAGQDFSRAINATKSPTDKVSAILQTQQALTTQRMGLENELLAAQIAKTKLSIATPSIPSLAQRYGIEGQSPTQMQSATTLGDNKLEYKQEIVPHAPGAPSQEYATIADTGYSRTAGGGYAPLPSKDVKERIEDNLLQEVLHAVRNNLWPSLGFNYNPPKTDGGPHGWGFNPFKQEYYKRKPVPGSFGYLYY